MLKNIPIPIRNGAANALIILFLIVEILLKDSQIKLPGKSVRFFKEAISKDNTLANANIARLYLEKGFYK
jgi:hypothetical protein